MTERENAEQLFNGYKVTVIISYNKRSTMPVVGNEVLCSSKFIKRVDLMLGVLNVKKKRRRRRRRRRRR